MDTDDTIGTCPEVDKPASGRRLREGLASLT